MRRIVAILDVVLGWVAIRMLLGHSVLPSVHLPHWLGTLAPGIFIIMLLGLVMIGPFLGAGRSPHTLIRPGETTVGLDDVVGIDGIKSEVVRSINLFLAHQTFRDAMGGSSRGAASCSRARRAPARPSWPRPWPKRPTSRSSSCRHRPSSRCSTGRPTARSGLTSSSCASTPAPRAARLASSKRSTPSAPRAAAWAPRAAARATAAWSTNCWCSCSPSMPRLAGSVSTACGSTPSTATSRASGR